MTLRKSKRQQSKVESDVVTCGRCPARHCVSTISTFDFRLSTLDARLSTVRRGFSMVELMIAIMILGLGLVMVATIFPVGLDMTRETVEKSITIDAVETAVDTVTLKVPTRHDEIWNAGNPAQVTNADVLLLSTPLVKPGDPTLELRKQLGTTGLPTSDLGIENDAEISALEQQVLNRTPFFSRADDGVQPTPAPLPELNNLAPPPAPADLVLRTRAMTEQTFWYEGGGYVHVLVGHNVPVDFVNRASPADPNRRVLMVEQLPAPQLPNATARLHLSEQIYPPLRTDDPALFTDLTLPARWTAELDLARRAAERRYSWSVIYGRQTRPRTFTLTVVILTRGELNNRFAYQQDQRDSPQVPGFNVYYLDLSAYTAGADTDPTESLFLPMPTTEAQTQSTNAGDPDLQDGFFPRPWLVALGLPPNVSPPPRWQVLPNPATGGFWTVNREGQGLCTAEVARLIPAGSTLVHAENGQPFRVLSSSWDLDELGKSPDSQSPARIQLEVSANYGGAALGVPVYVWVYPPPILSHEPATFDTRSPVIAAFQREVTLP